MPELLLSQREITWPPGLSLSAEDYQNLRRVILRCRHALTAIDGSGNSLLQLLLPYLLESPGILHGLLSIAVPHVNRSLRDTYHYKIAFLELSAEIRALQSNLLLDTRQLEKALASSFLLCLFTRSRCDDNWVQHHHQMINVLRLADHFLLSSSELGAFLISACGMQDISAFAVGRKQLSQHVWLSSMASRLARDPTSGFTAQETITGYPESLVTLIAYISEYSESNAYNEMQMRVTGSVSDVNCNFFPDSIQRTRELEVFITTWAPPPLLPQTPPMVAMALHTAWETMRLAACIYLWRGCGFHSNVLKPFPVEKNAQKELYIETMLSNARMIVGLAEQQGISVANALLWPLTVVACEGGLNKDRDDGLIAILDSIERIFSLAHVRCAKEVILRLWELKRVHIVNQEQVLHEPEIHISLESVAMEMNLAISIV